MITKRAVLFLTILLLIGCSEKKQKATPALKSRSSEIINIKEYLAPFDNILENSRVDIWEDADGNTTYTLIEVFYKDGMRAIFTQMDSDFEVTNVWEDLIEEHGVECADSYSRKCGADHDTFKFKQRIGDKMNFMQYDQHDNKLLFTFEFMGVEDNQAIFNANLIINDSEEEFLQRYYYSKGIGLTRFEVGDFSNQFVKAISEEEFFNNYLYKK